MMFGRSVVFTLLMIVLVVYRPIECSPKKGKFKFLTKSPEEPGSEETSEKVPPVSNRLQKFVTEAINSPKPQYQSGYTVKRDWKVSNSVLAQELTWKQLDDLTLEKMIAGSVPALENMDITSNIDIRSQLKYKWQKRFRKFEDTKLSDEFLKTIAHRETEYHKTFHQKATELKSFQEQSKKKWEETKYPEVTELSKLILWRLKKNHNCVLLNIQWMSRQYKNREDETIRDKYSENALFFDKKLEELRENCNSKVSIPISSELFWKKWFILEEEALQMDIMFGIFKNTIKLYEDIPPGTYSSWKKIGLTGFGKSYPKEGDIVESDEEIFSLELVGKSPSNLASPVKFYLPAASSRYVGREDPRFSKEIGSGEESQDHTTLEQILEQDETPHRSSDRLGSERITAGSSTAAGSSSEHPSIRSPFKSRLMEQTEKIILRSSQRKERPRSHFGTFSLESKSESDVSSEKPSRLGRPQYLFRRLSKRTEGLFSKSTESLDSSRNEPKSSKKGLFKSLRNSFRLRKSRSEIGIFRPSNEHTVYEEEQRPLPQSSTIYAGSEDNEEQTERKGKKGEEGENDQRHGE